MSSSVFGTCRLLFRGLGLIGLIMLMTQCATPKKNYGRKPPRNFSKAIGQLASGSVEDSLATPPHNFSQSEYPFDARGNYREDWLRSSTTSSSRASARGSSSNRASSSSGTPRYHVVRSGDTLFSLTRKYGVTLYSIRRENGLETYTIRIGQVLKIPAKN